MLGDSDSVPFILAHRRRLLTLYHLNARSSSDIRSTRLTHGSSLKRTRRDCASSAPHNMVIFFLCTASLFRFRCDI
jgi:hypothetical protein